MADDSVLDVEAYEVSEHGELERYARPPATLFGTDDPVAVIQKASEIASALADLISKQGLFSNIQGKTHVRVEGWTLLGTMLGIFPVLEYCHPVEVDGVKGFEAKVNAQTRDGDIVGSAVAYCMRSESRWKNADHYALCSMSQTRATSKALRGPLGFVVSLAGYEVTPAEEIPDERTAVNPAQAAPPPPRSWDPAEMLRSDAPSVKSGWKGIRERLNDIDPSIEWNPVIEQAIKSVFGADFELKGADPNLKAAAFNRTANAVGMLSELFAKETFLSLVSIQRAFAAMFEGFVVTVKEFEDAEPAPLTEKLDIKEGEAKDGS